MSLRCKKHIIPELRFSAFWLSACQHVLNNYSLVCCIASVSATVTIYQNYIICFEPILHIKVAHIGEGSEPLKTVQCLLTLEELQRKQPRKMSLLRQEGNLGLEITILLWKALWIEFEGHVGLFEHTKGLKYILASAAFFLTTHFLFFRVSRVPQFYACAFLWSAPLNLSHLSNQRREFLQDEQLCQKGCVDYLEEVDIVPWYSCSKLQIFTSWSCGR